MSLVIAMGRPEVRLKNLLLPGIARFGTHPPRKLMLPASREDCKGKASNTPKISIVVPSLNQGCFIEETLKSIVGQAYPNLELIVIDGGSSDGSLDVIKSFESHLAWWVSEPDNGQAAAINKGFLKATGEIMAWVNSDDRVAPDALYRVADYFQTHSETQVLYGNRILIDEQSREIGRWILPAHSDKVLKWLDFVPQETLYWRRNAWDMIGGQLDESFRFAMDWDLLLRFAGLHLKIENIPYVLGLFRIHPAQKTQKDMPSTGQEEMQKLHLRELGFLPSHRQVILNILPYLLAAKIHELNSNFGFSR